MMKRSSLSTKCDICGDVLPDSMVGHWKEKHPQYYKLHVKVWLFSGAVIIGGLGVLTFLTRTLGIEFVGLPSWLDYLVQAIITVILVLTAKWYLSGKRKSMKEASERFPEVPA